MGGKRCVRTARSFLVNSEVEDGSVPNQSLSTEGEMTSCFPPDGLIRGKSRVCVQQKTFSRSPLQPTN